MGLLEDLTSPAVLQSAWSSVAARRGVAGIDRVSIEDLGAHLDAELAQLGEEIRSGTYRPLPVLRIRPGFLKASDRALVIPAVRDRVVQRAIADLLSPRIDPHLSPACRAFRKGSSARAAAEDMGRWIEQGHGWALRADVKSFFDSIQPPVLRRQLAPFVDEEGLRFLDRILRCRIFDHDQVSDMVTGIPQGSPLSPLLGNLYLCELDAAVEKEHPKYVRYCDDLLVLGSDEETVRRAHELIAGLLIPLGLTLNEEKTRVCRVEDGFTFLGYHFGPTGRGPATKATEALHFRLTEIADGEELDVEELDAVYRGWTSYFGHHPSCWTEYPAGILALLRHVGPGDSGGEIHRLVTARRALTVRLSVKLGLALAAAWASCGHEEQSWLELAAACGGSRSALAEAESWSRLLRVEPGRLAEIARRLVGSATEQITLLSEAVAELGRYEVASRLATTGAGFAPAESGDTGGSAAGEPPSEADVQLLEKWFQGREGMHATESVDRAGHRSFLPVERPIRADDWRAHLRGERTLALALVRAGDSAVLGVLDVDLEKRLLDEHPGEVDSLLGRALGTALRLRNELKRRGSASLLEFSGHKGYHVWVRLAEPVPCFELRRWLREVVEAIGPLPEGVRVEVFPDRDRVRPEAIGPVIKLPLGIHSRTGRRCSLLDEAGRELDTPLEAIRSLPRVAAEIVCRRLPAAASAATGAVAPESPAIGPRAERLLERCYVLAHLARKVRQTSYLSHRERWSLLCTLGHLGDEGRAALHALIALTYNYRAEVTDRQIERLPPFPISCPKLREIHPEAAALGRCRCEFDLRGRGYPTPLLHALKPSEIPVFRKPSREVAQREPAPAAPALHQEAEDRVRKIAELKRHRRGIEASLERLHAELGALFDRAEAGGDALQLSTGVLRRVQRAGKEGWDFVIEV